LLCFWLRYALGALNFFAVFFFFFFFLAPKDTFFDIYILLIHDQNYALRSIFLLF
jgi:hypothetical protein